MDINQIKSDALDRMEDAAKKAIKLGSALDRLRSNRDFQLLIAEGYLKNEAVRLVHLKADPAMQDPANQANVVRDIDSIGVLASYFSVIATQATRAKDDLKQIEAERAFMASEEE